MFWTAKTTWCKYSSFLFHTWNPHSSLGITWLGQLNILFWIFITSLSQAKTKTAQLKKQKEERDSKKAAATWQYEPSSIDGHSRQFHIVQIVCVFVKNKLFREQFFLVHVLLLSSCSARALLGCSKSVRTSTCTSSYALSQFIGNYLRIIPHCALLEINKNNRIGSAAPSTCCIHQTIFCVLLGPQSK